MWGHDTKMCWRIFVSPYKHYCRFLLSEMLVSTRVVARILSVPYQEVLSVTHVDHYQIFYQNLPTFTSGVLRVLSTDMPMFTKVAAGSSPGNYLHSQMTLHEFLYRTSFHSQELLHEAFYSDTAAFTRVAVHVLFPFRTFTRG